jgi:subtilisin family serine protease
VRDHGLFIAGQVHLVAPGAEIGLYRALDDYARGDLATLDRLLLGFISEATNSGSGKAPTHGAVINLSLGVHTPQECLKGKEPPELPPHCGLNTEVMLAALERHWLYEDVVTLKTVLSSAYSQGIVVVGAAGNEWIGTGTAPPPQMPASFPDVLAVGGSNFGGVPSCFSNLGRVYAPGGDARSSAGACTMPDCSDTQKFVIGPVYGYPGSSGYGYWLGTSFAAPWVSGLAALLQQGQGQWTPPQVGRAPDIAARISDCALLSAGNVDVADSLNSALACPPPTPAVVPGNPTP